MTIGKSRVNGGQVPSATRRLTKPATGQHGARLRIAPRFVTSHPEYLWLNRLLCFGVGEYRAQTNIATYDVYAVR